MISLKVGLYFEDHWLAFPGFLISLRRIPKPNSSYVGFLKDRIKFLVNKPDIEHCFVLKEDYCDISNLIRYFERRCDFLFENQFKKYTIICVGTQEKLNKRLNDSGVYSRSKYPDGLDDLEWVSSKYDFASNEVINFMESPILLFGSTSYSGNVARNWCSAFVSFLSFGSLNISVYYEPFYLGRIGLRFCDLLES